MPRLDPPDVPDPLVVCAERRYEVWFRPNFPLLGLACWSLIHHLPGIIFDARLRDNPRLLKPIGFHEITHLDLEVPPAGGVLTGSRATIARIGSSIWTPEGLMLPDRVGEQDEPQLYYACEPDVFNRLTTRDASLQLSRAEHRAETAAREICMPTWWIKRWVKERVASGRVVDREEAVIELGEILELDEAIVTRYLWTLESVLGLGANWGLWDRGDQP